LNPDIASHCLIIRRSGRPIPRLPGERLHTRLIGKKIYCYKKVKSTQELALSLVERKATNLDGTVIIAERQTNAIGRAGRTWISPSGGIWMSVILNPNLLSSQSMLIMFLATLAVCEVLKSKTGLEPKIKWPNDVTINGRKVCGILVDVGAVNETICYAILGLGINVNNDTDKVIPKISKINSGGIYGITSLKKELGGLDVSIVDLTESLLAKLDLHYYQLQQGFSRHITQKWKYWSEYFNRPVIIKEHNRVFEATIEDIDLSGALVIRTLDGSTRTILTQDVVL
jgi:BirA family transcriptional regulator, biotin operon repressor / biotin---[acetyl-CoA-carboxylase] ligase